MVPGFCNILTSTSRFFTLCFTARCPIHLHREKPQQVVIYLNFFDYSLPSLKPSQSLSFEEEKAVERKIASFSSFAPAR